MEFLRKISTCSVSQKLVARTMISYSGKTITVFFIVIFEVILAAIIIWAAISLGSGLGVENMKGLVTTDDEEVSAIHTDDEENEEGVQDEEEDPPEREEQQEHVNGEEQPRGKGTRRRALNEDVDLSRERGLPNVDYLDHTQAKVLLAGVKTEKTFREENYPGFDLGVAVIDGEGEVTY